MPVVQCPGILVERLFGKLHLFNGRAVACSLQSDQGNVDEWSYGRPGAVTIYMCHGEPVTVMRPEEQPLGKKLVILAYPASLKDKINPLLRECAEAPIHEGEEVLKFLRP